MYDMERQSHCKKASKQYSYGHAYVPVKLFPEMAM